MKSREFGLAAGLLAIVAAAGCASLTEPSRGAVLADYSSSLEGIWEGQVWENPSDYRQGVQNIRVDISRTGSWTATTKGAECARGEALVRADLVILRSRAEAGPPCRPHSLRLAREHMWGEFGAGFKQRAATAMVDLVRVRERPPESASAPRPR
jgi:ABC-type phosphate transport system substrate-binding protein